MFLYYVTQDGIAIGQPHTSATWAWDEMEKLYRQGYHGLDVEERRIGELQLQLI